MLENRRLSFIYGSIDIAKEAFFSYSSAFESFPHTIQWSTIALSMGQLLESYIATRYKCETLVEISCNPEYVLYDTCISGFTTVSSEYCPEKDLEIQIDLSSDLYNNSILMTDDYIRIFQHMFVLTFIHELTHVTQYDDLDVEILKGSKKEQYLSSAFEIDAYSTECAYDVYCNGGFRTKTEAYQRYNAVRDRSVFREFRDTTLEKVTYLQNDK